MAGGGEEGRDREGGLTDGGMDGRRDERTNRRTEEEKEQRMDKGTYVPREVGTGGGKEGGKRGKRADGRVDGCRNDEMDASEMTNLFHYYFHRLIYFRLHNLVKELYSVVVSVLLQGFPSDGKVICRRFS